MEKVLRDGERISYGLWGDENDDYVGIARLPDLSILSSLPNAQKLRERSRGRSMSDSRLHDLAARRDWPAMHRLFEESSDEVKEHFLTECHAASKKLRTQDKKLRRKITQSVEFLRGMLWGICCCASNKRSQFKVRHSSEEVICLYHTQNYNQLIPPTLAG